MAAVRIRINTGGEVNIMGEELVIKAKQGDKSAFEQLVRQYEKKVYNIALRMSGSPEDAFDLAQEAFLNVYRSLGNFREDAAFSTWLYRIVSNVCLDFARKKANRLKHEQYFITHDDDESDQMAEVPDLRYSPETQQERKQLAEALALGIGKLSPEHRQVFLLREISGLTYQEIAQSLDMEEGTVKSRLSRAREKLRVFLAENGNFPSGSSSNDIARR